MTKKTKKQTISKVEKLDKKISKKVKAGFKTKKSKKSSLETDRSSDNELDFSMITRKLKENNGKTLHNYEDSSKTLPYENPETKKNNFEENSEEELHQRIFLENVKTSEDVAYIGQAILAPFQDLLGLQNLKEKVKKLAFFQIINERRRNKNLKTFDVKKNWVFFGDSKTGKTTAALCMGQVFIDLNMSHRSKVIQVSISNYTSPDVSANDISHLFARAFKGTLLIDDITSSDSDLYYFRRNHDAFFNNFLACLSKNDGNANIILSGNAEGISKIFRIYPELEKYFSEKIEFLPLNFEEAFELFQRLCEENQIILSAEAYQAVLEILDDANKRKNHIFKGANGAKQLFEKILEKQSLRLLQFDTAILDENKLVLIEREDIPRSI